MIIMKTIKTFLVKYFNNLCGHKYQRILYVKSHMINGKRCDFENYPKCFSKTIDEIGVNNTPLEWDYYINNM